MKHGHSKRFRRSRAYSTWAGMLSRCRNPKTTNYYAYGGRGISVCERWLKFENFLEDMGHPPEGMQLERKDNSAGYSPQNCTWSTPIQQGQNRRGNRHITVRGERLTLSEACRRIGMDPRTVYKRAARHGEDHTEAFLKLSQGGEMRHNPRNSSQIRWITLCGDRMSCAAACDRFGMSAPSVFRRVSRTGESFIEAFLVLLDRRRRVTCLGT